jgi:hypothetical protein
MPKVGVEPTRAIAHYALNVARLPVPPLRHTINLQTMIIRYFRLFVKPITRFFILPTSQPPPGRTPLPDHFNLLFNKIIDQ